MEEYLYCVWFIVLEAVVALVPLLLPSLLFLPFVAGGLYGLLAGHGGRRWLAVAGKAPPPDVKWVGASSMLLAWLFVPATVGATMRAFAADAAPIDNFTDVVAIVLPYLVLPCVVATVLWMVVSVSLTLHGRGLVKIVGTLADLLQALCLIIAGTVLGLATCLPRDDGFLAVRLGWLSVSLGFVGAGLLYVQLLRRTLRRHRAVLEVDADAVEAASLRAVGG